LNKILFITDNFPPETNAPAIRTFEHTKIWAQKGYLVTVVTCFPNFPKGKVFEGFKNKLYQIEVVENVRVIRIWSYITSNSGFLKRSIDFFSFCVSSLIAGLFIKTDIIIATSPQFFTTWSAYLLSKIKRKPWVFELRDLWPETIKAVGSIKNEKLYNFLEKIEIGLYNNADLIIPVTDSFKQNLISRGVNRKKIKVITNGIDRHYFNSSDKKKDINKIIGYVGTHGLCQKLQFILDVINNNSLNEFTFNFVGDGADKKKLIEFKNINNLKNVFFFDSVGKEKVNEILLGCSALLVPLRKNDTFKTVIPSKIFEAAYLKIPIILGVEGEAQKIIENYKLGVCYEPENEKSFLNALESIMNFEFDDDLYLKFIEDFSRENLAEKMLNHLIELK